VAAHDVKFLEVNRDTPIVNVVRAIATDVRSQRSIWRLMLLAHGNSGWLELGTGLDSNSARFFSALRSYFTPNGEGIEIHGCGVASSSVVTLEVQKGTGQSWSGAAWLYELARVTGVQVMAAVDVQWTHDDGFFNGPYQVVQPNGYAEVRDGRRVDSKGRRIT